MILVVVLDSVITHTTTWFLDGKIHQLVFYGFSRQLALIKDEQRSLTGCMLHHPYIKLCMYVDWTSYREKILNKGLDLIHSVL